MFNSREFGWSDVDIALQGKLLTKAVAVEHTESQEVKKMRGKGVKPFGIKAGNIDVKGKIEMYKSEFDVLLAQTGNKGVSGLKDLTLTVAYTNEAGDLAVNTVVGIVVTEIGQGVKQGDMEIIIPLPFEALDIKYA